MVNPGKKGLLINSPIVIYTFIIINEHNLTTKTLILRVFSLVVFLDKKIYN